MQSPFEEVKKILTHLVTESIRHADAEAVFDVESFAHAICRLFEKPKYDTTVSGLTVLGEPKAENSRLLTPEQMAVEMNKLGGEATYKNGLEAIAKAQLAKDLTCEQARVERLLKEIEKHVSTGHWLEKGFVEWDWWQAIKEREMGKKAENGRKD